MTNCVEIHLIKNRVSAYEVFQIVKYLTANYFEGYIDGITHTKYSYRSLLNNLTSRFSYAKEPYPSSAGFRYVFNKNDIWENFLLTEADLSQIISYRRIDSYSELHQKAVDWLNSPYKSRQI